MKGLLLFFQKDFTDDEYDSQATYFQNPKINDVGVTVAGISHKIYKQGLKPYQHWSRSSDTSCQKTGKQMRILTSMQCPDDKYALWIDLRSTEVNGLLGLASD
jgi:hypothetical protein